MEANRSLRTIRILVTIFIVCLALSGITAFPLITEMSFLERNKAIIPGFMHNWIDTVYNALIKTDKPILYGMDWLAFGHLVIATFFIAVYKDPVRYKFNVITGIVASIAIFPIAFICGPIRDIPFFHQLINCSFGVIALIPLTIIYKKINQIEKYYSNEQIN